MKTLGQLLLEVPQDRRLVAHSQGTLGRDELVRAMPLSAVSGRSVAIYTEDVAQAIRWLVALDGAAQKVLLLSASTDPQLALDLAQEAGCDHLLTTRPDLAESLGDIVAVRSIEELSGTAQADVHAELATTWTLTTSGTTGRPKLIDHTLDSLTRSTKIDHGRAVGHVWAMLYDYSRFAGIQVVLQSLLSGAELAAPLIDEPLKDQVAFLLAHQCTHVSCTPTLWRKLLMTPGFSELPVQQATLGGEIADDRVLAAIQEKFPKARITHIYASTEAGVGFSVSDRRAGFPTKYLDSRDLGVGLRLSSDDVLEIQTEQSSEWINTNDRVRISGDRVVFLGRNNGTINVGGDKVHPEEVESVILDHTDVLATRVFGRHNAIVGAVVCAEVQMASNWSNAGGKVSHLREFLAKRLPRHKIPAIIKVVDNIEVSSAGKIERNIV